MGLYRRGKYWWMSYQSEATGGRQIYKPLKTINKREAERRYRSLCTEIERGTFKLSAPRRMQFDKLCKMFLEKHAAFKRSGWRDEMTIRRHLLPWFKDLRLSAIDQKMITDYKAQRANAVKPATVNRELALLKTLFSKAIAWGMADRNPVKQVELFDEDNQIERVLTEDEEARLLDDCVGRFAYLRSFIILALNTGMRRGELLTLKWGNVNLPFGQIVVEATNAKAKRRRMIPINSKVREIVENLRSNTSSQYVLSKSTGKPYSKWTVDKHFRDLCNRVGTTGLRIHDLRHTFASRLSAKGVDIVTIKDLLGHHSITMTMRYAHSNSHKQAVDLLCEPAAGSDNKVLQKYDTDR